MAYPRSRSFKYFGKQTVTPMARDGARRPPDPDMKAIMDAVSRGDMTVAEGVQAMQDFVAKRDEVQS